MRKRKQTLASEVLAALGARNWSLATAESCTGGGVGQTLTAVPGSSKTYRGGIISYTNSVKSRLLGVSETMLQELGAVSGPVAEAMAQGAREAVSADVAVSTTGLAGPGGDAFGNPVGTVWIGCAWPGGGKSVLCRFQGSREEIREAACCRALELLLEELQGSFG